MTLTFRRSNSGCSLAMYPSSVVQTGVKSLGWEKRIAHESPIHSWKLMRPFGGVSLEVRCGVVDGKPHVYHSLVYWWP